MSAEKYWVFVHDHKFIQIDGECYSTGSFPSRVWARYLECCPSLCVIGRLSLASTTDGLTRSGRPGVKFCLLNMGAQAIVGDIFNAIKTMLTADRVIVRLPSGIGLVLLVVCLAFHKRYAVELVGCPRDALRSAGRPILRAISFIFMLATRALVRRADRVLYVTNRFLQSRYPTRAPSVSVSNVEVSQILGERLTKRVDQGTIVFGVIGYIGNSYKGVDLAIRALSRLARRGCDVTLRVLGAGDAALLKAMSEKLGIGNRVFFDGLLPSGGAVCDWLDRLDVYLQPSRSEGMPRSLIEAMSRRLPCVGSAAGGIPELLPSQYLHPVGSVDQLECAMYAFWDSIKLSAAAGEENARVASRYLSGLLMVKRNKFWRDYADEDGLRDGRSGLESGTNG